MTRLIVHKPGYFLIMADSASDLRALARKAGLKIATECHCGNCGLGSGRHGFADGSEMLAIASRARHYADLRFPTLYGGIYLATEFGDFDVSDDSMLAATCRPGFASYSNRKVNFQVGLNYRAGGGGKELPAPARHLIETVSNLRDEALPVERSRNRNSLFKR